MGSTDVREKSFLSNAGRDRGNVNYFRANKKYEKNDRNADSTVHVENKKEHVSWYNIFADLREGFAAKTILTSTEFSISLLAPAFHQLVIMRRINVCASHNA